MRKLLIALSLLISFTVHAQWYTQSPTLKSAFGLDMVASPYSVIDLKTLHDKVPEVWDEELLNGATSVFYKAQASTVLTTDSVTEAAIRQTYMRFPYQPGKGQRIYFTGIVEPETGTIKRYGYYNNAGQASASPYADTLDGVYFKTSNDTMFVCSARYGTEECVAQPSWNKNTGASIDWSKAQVFYVQFGWLGYKGVRFGTVQNGAELLLHETVETNTDTIPFMQSPNHSIRGEIRQVAAGAGTNTLKMTCAAVQSEGGLEPLGRINAFTTGGTHIDLASEDTSYVVFAYRVATNHRDVAVDLNDLDILVTTASHDVLYEIWIGGAVHSGTLTFGNGGSCIEVAQGNGTQTYDRSGIRVAAGYASSGGNQGGTTPATVNLRSALRAGVDIAGVRQIVYITVMPIAGSTAVDVHPSFAVREY